MRFTKNRPLPSPRLILSIFLVLTLLSASYLFYLYLRGEAVPGELRIDGGTVISSEKEEGVRIYRVEALQFQDLFTALGYIHGFEHLPGLVEKRKMFRGNLSEDGDLSEMGWNALARQATLDDSAGLGAEALALLSAYADGLNQYQSERALPWPLKGMQGIPEAWTATDILGLYRLIPFLESREWKKAVVYEELLRYYGPMRLTDILPQAEAWPEPRWDLPSAYLQILQAFHELQQAGLQAAAGDGHTLFRRSRKSAASYRISATLGDRIYHYSGRTDRILPFYTELSDSLGSEVLQPAAELMLRFDAFEVDRKGLMLKVYGEWLPLTLLRMEDRTLRRFGGALVLNDILKLDMHGERLLTLSLDSRALDSEINILLRTLSAASPSALSAAAEGDVSGPEDPVYAEDTGSAEKSVPAKYSLYNSADPLLFKQTAAAGDRIGDIDISKTEAAGDLDILRELYRLDRARTLLDRKEREMLDMCIYPRQAHEYRFSKYMAGLYAERVTGSLFGEKTARMPGLARDFFYSDRELTGQCLRALFENPDSWWCDLEATAEREDLAAVLKREWRRQLSELERELGPYWREWEHSMRDN